MENTVLSIARQRIKGKSSTENVKVWNQDTTLQNTAKSYSMFQLRWVVYPAQDSGQSVG